MADSSEVSSRPARLPLLLGLLLLAVPGAGSSRFNGLPFDSKLEVAALFLFGTVIIARSVRRQLASLLSPPGSRQAAVLVLVVVIVLKLFSFVRFPIGENFETCLKGIYKPTVSTCEKSFDYFFYPRDAVNNKDAISRVDRVVNFRTSTGDPSSTLGASHSTWRLPFKNEYPRFDQLWLDRLPFTADIGAVINPSVRGFLPIEFVGELGASVGDASISGVDYEFRRVAFLPVSADRQELLVRFRFSDDNTEAMPEVAPPARGPYAHLVIGDVMGPEDSSQLNLMIRGHVIDISGVRRPQRVELRSDSQSFSVPLVSRPDVAIHFGDPRHELSGFIVVVPANRDLSNSGSYELFVVFDDGGEASIGTVSLPDFSTGAPDAVATPEGSNSIVTDFKAWMSFKDQPPLLHATYHIPPSHVGLIDLWTVEIAQFLMVALAAALIAIQITTRLRGFFSVIALVGLVAAFDFASRKVVMFEVFGQGLSKHLLTAVIIGAAAWLANRARPHIMLYGFLISAVIAIPRTLEAYRVWSGLSEAPWWGFMIFRDRAMDWLVFQGYAYTILAEQSLRAGETEFYFVPGARYFIFISHLLFGNNDTFIGVLVGTGLVATTLWFLAKFSMTQKTGRSQSYLEALVGFSLLTVVLSGLSIQLSAASSSEAFAWTLLFASTAALVSPKYGNTTAFLGGCGLGLVTFLRPNYLAVSLLFTVAFIGVIAISQSQLSALLRSISASWLLLGSCVCMSLALIHNVYFGRSFTPFVNATSGGTELFPTYKLFGLLWDREVQSAIWTRLTTYAYWTGLPSSAESLGSWVAQVAYLVAIIRLAVSRTLLLPRAMFLLAPVGYVISTTPYAITTIPERQSNMFTFALAVSAGISTILETRNAVREVPGAVSSREHDKSTQSATS